MSRLHTPVGPEDHVAGLANAKVTLVEYGDYECPHCGAAYPLFKEIQRQMGHSLRFVFRNFPLAESHPHAVMAAEAAEAAAAQGKFWEMHDVLFERQTSLEPEDLLGYAKELGLEMKAFERAMETHAFQAHIEKDFSGGVRSGVNGTPTMFIGDQRYDGPGDLHSIVAALKAAAGHR